MKIDSPTFVSETQFISASVVYSSGSQKFGNTEDDQHTFVGSITASGNIELTGASKKVSGSSTSTGSFGAIKTNTIQSARDNERLHLGSMRNGSQGTELFSDQGEFKLSTGDSGTVCVIQDDNGTAVGC